MAKRIADKELTDRNWDQEEEGEEAGTFSIASDDVMKNRPIKKAKRRNTGAEGEVSAAFKGFKGFAASSSSSSSSSAPLTAFSGFGNGGGGGGFAGLSNGNSFGGFSSTASPGLTFNGPSSFPSLGDITAKQTNGSGSSLLSPASSKISSITSSTSTTNTNTNANTNPSSNNKEYSRQLTALNVSVRDWITKHVNDNPLCDLNPIFKDYETHLASIEKKYGATSSLSSASSSVAFASVNVGAGAGEKKGELEEEKKTLSATSTTNLLTAAASPFSFGRKTTEEESKEDSKAAPIPAGLTFNFGQKVDSSILGSLATKTPSFSFSSEQKTGPSSVFGSTIAPTASKHTDENGEEESEEPPKPEIKEVKEDDAFYSKKCKLFYKKDTEFKEKGVGTLHLKETDGKTQMVIRADTNLGNILLNVLLSPSMPCSRVGKNNVMIVCVPNPPIDDKEPDKPFTLLIRVKTGEDADALFNTMEERKKRE